MISHTDYAALAFLACVWVIATIVLIALGATDWAVGTGALALLINAFALSCALPEAAKDGGLIDEDGDR